MNDAISRVRTFLDRRQKYQGIDQTEVCSLADSEGNPMPLLVEDLREVLRLSAAPPPAVATSDALDDAFSNARALLPGLTIPSTALVLGRLRERVDAVLAATQPSAAGAAEQAVAWALKFQGDGRLCLSTVFDTQEEAETYARGCRAAEVIPLYLAAPVAALAAREQEPRGKRSLAGFMYRHAVDIASKQKHANGWFRGPWQLTFDIEGAKRHPHSGVWPGFEFYPLYRDLSDEVRTDTAIALREEAPAAPSQQMSTSDPEGHRQAIADHEDWGIDPPALAAAIAKDGRNLDGSEQGLE